MKTLTLPSHSPTADDKGPGFQKPIKPNAEEGYNAPPPMTDNKIYPRSGYVGDFIHLDPAITPDMVFERSISGKTFYFCHSSVPAGPTPTYEIYFDDNPSPIVFCCQSANSGGPPNWRLVISGFSFSKVRIRAFANQNRSAPAPNTCQFTIVAFESGDVRIS